MGPASVLVQLILYSPPWTKPAAQLLLANVAGPAAYTEASLARVQARKSSDCILRSGGVESRTFELEVDADNWAGECGGLKELVRQPRFDSPYGSSQMNDYG